MSGTRFEASVDIAAPAAAAWAVLADYAHDVAWRGEVVSMTPTPAGPSAPGTTTVEVARLLGSTFTTPGEVVAVDDGRRLAWRASSDAVEVSGERIVEPITGDHGDRGRCRVRLTYDLRPQGTTRLLSPILTWAFRRAVRRNLATLAALVASRGVARSA